MKCLNKFFCTPHCYSAKRWGCCICCTVFLILLILMLPFWNFHVTSSVSSAISENAVSVVKVTQRKKICAVEKAAEKIVEKPVIQKTDTIPAPIKEKIEDQLEEAREDLEPQEELEDAPEEVEEENFASDAADSVQTQSAGEYSDQTVISEEIQKATTSYKSYALSRIAGKKQYPYSARSKGLEGKVRARVCISPDGTLSDCEILKKCEYEILNEACLSAIKKSAPFKKMPAGMKELTFTFVMDFSLN